MMSSGKKTPPWVKLNVGGTTFLTTRTTLARHPGSVLHRLCQGDSDSKTDESGAYLIDRNPNYFAPVLDFLRHGELIMDDHVAEKGVLKEAEFFKLPELVRLVESRIKSKVQRQAYAFDHDLSSEELREDVLSYIRKNFKNGWKVDQMINFPPEGGAIVTMSKRL